MNQYDRLYNIMSEMVWTIKGKPAKPRKFRPSIGRALKKAPRKVATTVGSLSQEIQGINVSPEKTEVGDWEAGAKKRLVRAIRTSGKAPNVPGLPGHPHVRTVSVGPEDETPTTSSPEGDRGRTRTALEPGSRPRGSSGKRAGRNPKHPRRR